MVVSKKKIACLGASLAVVLLSGCVTTGSSGTASRGAVAGSTAVNHNDGLERCDSPLGTLIVDDNRDKEWYEYFNKQTKISTIEPLVRLTVMQSNCFVITAAGNQRTDEKLHRISQMQRHSGEYRSDSGFHAGQRVASDYFMEMAIVINNEQVSSMSSGASFGSNAGLAGALVGGLAGALMSQVDQKVSVVTMSMFDIRTGVQLAMAEGNSKATDFRAAMNVFGPQGEASLKGFSRTPEGKATVAAFVDAYNSMVIALRNYKAQEVEGGLGRGGRLTVAN